MIAHIRHMLRGQGVYLTAHEALVICGALSRVYVEDGSERADVIRRFRQRCQDLDRRRWGSRA